METISVAEYLVGPFSEVSEKERKLVTIAGREIIVFRQKDRVYALSNYCLHMGGPVGEGKLIGRVESHIAEDGTHLGDRFSEEVTHIVCPWHGYEYDIETGVCAALPAEKLKRYLTEVRDGNVYLTV